MSSKLSLSNTDHVVDSEYTDQFGQHGIYTGSLLLPACVSHGQGQMKYCYDDVNETQICSSSNGGRNGSSLRIVH